MVAERMGCVHRLLAADGFVEVQKQAGQGCPRGHCAVIQARLPGCVSGSGEFGCRLWGAGESRSLVFQVVQKDGGFGRGRWSGKRQEKQSFQSGGIPGELRAQHAFGQNTSGFGEGDVVHQCQCLQWSVGSRRPNHAGLASAGVKSQHRGVRYGSLGIRVETATVKVAAGGLVVVCRGGDFLPKALGLVRPDRGAPDSLVEKARSEECLVADDLCRKPVTRCPCQKSVLRVTFQLGGGHSRGLAVGAAGDNQADDGFHVPVVVVKLGCQPVEELWVGGQFALRAKVLGRPHKANPKESLPQAVGDHPGGKGVFLVDQPTGKPQAIRWTVCGQLGKRRWSARLDGSPRSVVLAPDQDVSFSGLWKFLHDHDCRNRFVERSRLTVESNEAIHSVPMCRAGVPGDEIIAKLGGLAGSALVEGNFEDRRDVVGYGQDGDFSGGQVA